MTTRSTPAFLRRLGFGSRSDAGSRRNPFRSPKLTDRARAVASPRRAWLLGLDLRPKTVPLRRLG
jgi:hypothetical protein